LYISKKYSIYNVLSELQWSDVIHEQLFLLPYSTGRTFVIVSSAHDPLEIAQFLVFS